MWGKSTLLNHILGQKLAITSRKPQTTRHNMLGIKTEGEVQAVYVDTPGLHKSGEKALNRYMNSYRQRGIEGCRRGDLRGRPHPLDRRGPDGPGARAVRQLPVLIAVNKTDRIEERPTCCRTSNGSPSSCRRPR